MQHRLYDKVAPYCHRKSVHQSQSAQEQGVLRHRFLLQNPPGNFQYQQKLVPIFFTWEDGRKYSIDRILKIERCASKKAGGVGMMYTCMIQGQESHLFYEVDKWFMERKTA